MTKRVWILGAGFSRPLGGPLLNDVFSMRTWRRLMAKWPDIFQTRHIIEDQALLQVYGLYHFGMKFPEGPLMGAKQVGPGEKLWDHAEDFLVKLCRAAEDNEEREHLHSVVESLNHELGWEETDEPWSDNMLKPDKLLYAAGRIMAAECEVFLSNADPMRHSAWLPYQHWASVLTEDDTIVTFNYDRVLETLQRKDQLQRIGIDGARAGFPRLPVCKMHGSTDWYFQRGVLKAIDSALLTEKLRDPEDAPAIGLPGALKDRMTEEVFADIWSHAAKALQEATEVHIIGYSLPESDAKSREWLLKNLWENRSDTLTVSITLGRPDFHTRRLESMLRMAMPHRIDPDKDVRRNLPKLIISTHEMWAQDHLNSFAQRQRERPRN